MDIMRELTITHDEYAKWREVVTQLKAIGAVTQRDCQSPPSVLETPGQKLFEAIRQWGDSLVELRRQEDRDAK